MTDYTTVRIRKSQKPRFEQAKEAIASDLGERPSQDQVIGELVEAYLGGDTLGIQESAD